MSDKTFGFWLLLLTTVTVGCEKPRQASSPSTSAKERTAQDNQIKTHKFLQPATEEGSAFGVSKTPDMIPYHWPEDFKLPLNIEMETPEVPKEIQGPSPPIEEEQK